MAAPTRWHFATASRGDGRPTTAMGFFLCILWGVGEGRIWSGCCYYLEAYHVASGVGAKVQVEPSFIARSMRKGTDNNCVWCKGCLSERIQ